MKREDIEKRILTYTKEDLEYRKKSQELQVRIKELSELLAMCEPQVETVKKKNPSNTRDMFIDWHLENCKLNKPLEKRKEIAALIYDNKHHGLLWIAARFPLLKFVAANTKDIPTLNRSWNFLKEEGLLDD
jgi:hypothetical protein